MAKITVPDPITAEVRRPSTVSAPTDLELSPLPIDMLPREDQVQAARERLQWIAQHRSTLNGDEVRAMLDSLNLRSLLIRPQTPPAAAAPSTAVSPSSAAASKDRDAVWHRPGHAFCLGDVKITGGWVYVGETLAENPADTWSRRNAPGLINPKLKVGAPLDVPADISPYTSYADLSPPQRGYYLRWLAGDRSDPNTPAGYVRLYFLGLEHRVVMDKPDPAEIAAVVAEVARLGDVYRPKGGTSYHCDRLAQVLQFRLFLSDPAAMAAWRPPANLPVRQGFSMPLKLVIAHKVVAAEPLDFELAMAGYLSLPSDYTEASRVAARVPHLLALLAPGPFVKKYPKGFRLRDRQSSQLSASYQTANYKLPNPDWLPNPYDRLPDPERLNWRGMINLCAPLIERLKPYADYLNRTRHPDSLEGLLLLPPEALDAQQKDRLVSAANRLAALARPVGSAPTAELAARLVGSAEDWNLSKLRQLHAVVSGLGYDMEPDPTLAKVTAKAEPQVWVFKANTAATLPDAGLELASVLFLALGHARGGEPGLRAGFDPWVVCTAEVLQVEAAHLPRLEARFRRLSRQAPTVSRLARAVEALSPDDKAHVAEAANALVSQIGCRTRSMMIALENLYDTLKLERRALYGDLHRRDAAQDVDAMSQREASDLMLTQHPWGLVGIDQDRRVYLRESGGEIGFDEVYDLTIVAAQRLNRPDLGPPKRRGTRKAFARYRATSAAASEAGFSAIMAMEAASPSLGFAIPRPPSTAWTNPGVLDMTRVQSIVMETQAVSATLAAIYEDEGSCDPAAPPPAPVKSDGLDLAHETLLGELAARDAWSAADLEALCRRSGLMAAAAVEVLNDWAYERCGEPVLEDEGEWRVNRDILEAARRAGA